MLSPKLKYRGLIFLSHLCAQTCLSYLLLEIGEHMLFVLQLSGTVRLCCCMVAAEVAVITV